MALNLNLPYLDVDAWSQLLGSSAGVPVGGALPKSKVSPKNARVVGLSADAGNAMDYLPTTIAVRADQIKLTERVLHQVVVGGSRAGDVWRTQYQRTRTQRHH